MSLIDLILDVLAEADPLGLRRRLDCVDIPGTKAWEAKDRAARIRWWVRRVGALDTVLVAFPPGVFGAVADRLPSRICSGSPIRPSCCAPSRVSTASRIRRPGCGCWRRCCAHGRSPTKRSPNRPSRIPAGPRCPCPRKVWHLAGILNAIGAELGKRPPTRRACSGTWACCPGWVLSPTTSVSTAPDACRRGGRNVDHPAHQRDRLSRRPIGGAVAWSVPAAPRCGRRRSTARR